MQEVTFERVRSWLHEDRVVALEGETYIVFDVADQRVRVVYREALGLPWLVIASTICEQELVEHDGALIYNRYHEGIGSIAIEQGYVQLRVQLPLAGFDRSMLAATIEHIADEAARLRVRARPGRTHVSELFINFQD